MRLSFKKTHAPGGSVWIVTRVESSGTPSSARLPPPRLREISMYAATSTTTAVGTTTPSRARRGRDFTRPSPRTTSPLPSSSTTCQIESCGRSSAARDPS
jgi:hypothetical protein